MRKRVFGLLLFLVLVVSLVGVVGGGLTETYNCGDFNREDCEKHYEFGGYACKNFFLGATTRCGADVNNRVKECNLGDTAHIQREVLTNWFGRRFRPTEYSDLEDGEIINLEEANSLIKVSYEKTEYCHGLTVVGGYNCFSPGYGQEYKNHQVLELSAIVDGGKPINLLEDGYGIKDDCFRLAEPEASFFLFDLNKLNLDFEGDYEKEVVFVLSLGEQEEVKTEVIKVRKNGLGGEGEACEVSEDCPPEQFCSLGDEDDDGCPTDCNNKGCPESFTFTIGIIGERNYNKKRYDVKSEKDSDGECRWKVSLEKSKVFSLKNIGTDKNQKWVDDKELTRMDKDPLLIGPSRPFEVNCEKGVWVTTGREFACRADATKGEFSKCPPKDLSGWDCSTKPTGFDITSEGSTKEGYTPTPKTSPETPHTPTPELKNSQCLPKPVEQEETACNTDDDCSGSGDEQYCNLETQECEQGTKVSCESDDECPTSQVCNFETETCEEPEEKKKGFFGRVGVLIGELIDKIFGGKGDDEEIKCTCTSEGRGISIDGDCDDEDPGIEFAKDEANKNCIANACKNKGGEFKVNPVYEKEKELDGEGKLICIAKITSAEVACTGGGCPGPFDPFGDDDGTQDKWAPEVEDKTGRAPAILPEQGNNEDEPNCPGDFDGSRVVDKLDLEIFSDEFGTKNCASKEDGCKSDMDGDEDVDVDDFYVFSNHYGIVCSETIEKPGSIIDDDGDQGEETPD